MKSLIMISHLTLKTHSRERNRVHARKTRKRKKVQMESIQVTIENLQEEGRRMRLAVTEWYTANILLVMRGPEAEKEEALKSEAPNHAPNSGPQCKGQPSGSAPAGSTTGANDGLLSKYMTVQSFLERTNAAVAANNKAYEEAQSRAASESGLMDDSSSLGDADEADEGKAGGARGRCKYAPEDRERIRRERNRIHAKRTRDRRKRFMEESEKVMTRLLKENEELRQMLDLIYGDHAPVAGNQPGRSHPPQPSHHLPPHPQLAQSFAQFPSNGQALYPAAPVPQGGASGEGSSVASSSTTFSSASSQATGSVTMTTGKTPEENSHHSGNGRAPRPEGARVGQEGGSQGSEQEGLGDEDEDDDEVEEEEEEDERAYKAPKQVSPRWSEVPPSQVGEHWATSRPHLAAPSHQSGLRSVPPYPLSFPPTSAGTTQNGAPTDVGTEYKVEGSSMMRAIAPMGVLSAPTADDESRCRSPLHQQPPMPSIPIQAGAESCDVLEAGSGRKGETKPEPPSMQAV